MFRLLLISLSLIFGVIFSYRSQSTIWTSDFSNPSDWVIANNATTGSLNWEITNTMPASANNADLYKYWLTPASITAFKSTSGGNFLLMNASKAGTGTRTAIVTKAMPFNTLGKNNIKVQYNQLYRKWKDSTLLEVSTDGQKWTKFVYNDTKYKSDVSSTNPELVGIDISSVAANQSQVWIRFRFVGTTAANDYDYAWFIDDVTVTEIPQNEVSVFRGVIKGQTQAIQSCLTNTNEIAIYVKNNGLATLNTGTLPISYKINGGTSVTENAQWLDYKTLQPKSTLAYNDTALCIFTSKLDFTQANKYVIKAYASLPSDAMVSNDTATMAITNKVSTLVTNQSSFVENFEGASMNGFTALDIDKRGYGFGVANTGNTIVTTGTQQAAVACLRISEPQGKSDDWAFSPCLELKKGFTYNLSLYARVSANTTSNGTAVNFAGTYETKVGKLATADGMTIPVMNATTLSADGKYYINNSTFTVTEDATYYLGIHVYNTDDTKYTTVRFDDITLTAKSNACEITSYGFTSPQVTGTINGNNIAITVPAGTNVSNLISTFTLSSGATVKVGTTAQVSGQTANNFTTAVTYDVTAEDGTTTKQYTVNVTIEQAPKSNACDITAFSFVNPAVSGTISGNNITLTVPTGTNVSNLIAQFALSTGATAKVGTTSQVSGQTTNNFTNAVTYIVTAEDGTTTKSYTVTVNVQQGPKSNACDITSFGFTSPLTTGVINGNNITLTVPSGTNVTGLIAQFTASTGATVKVGSMTQISGQTTNNFTNAVTYIVTAEDGTTSKTYTVNVTIQTQNCQDLDNWAKGNNTTPKLYSIGAGGFITDGYLTGVNKYYFQGLYEKYSDIGDTKNHQLKTVSYWFGNIVAGAPSNTLKFIGYKPDPTTKLPKDTIFVVTKTVDEVAKGLDNNGFYNLDLSNTKVKFSGDFYVGISFGYKNEWGGTSTTTPQDTIAILSNDYQASGATINSAYIGFKTSNGFIFDTLIPTGKISYGIFPTICDLSSANDIVSFGFTNPAAQGVISGNTINVTVPIGTNLQSLIPTFTISQDAEITIGNVKQISGQTSNNYTSALTYTVTADDGSTKNYTVVVTFQQAPKSNACDITAYSFVSPQTTGVINGNNITLTVPTGTNVTNLIAQFTASTGATVKVGSTTQISGQTANNFSNSVTYIVTAEDGTTTKSYTVTVNVQQAPKSNACDITSYSFTNPAVSGTISGNNITLTVPTGTNVSNIIAQFVLSTGATAKVGTTSQVSGQTANNFTTTVTYIVTAEDGTTSKTYTVNVTIQTQNCQDLDNWAKGNNTTPKLYSIGAGGFITDGYLTGVNKYYFQGLYEKYSDIGDTKNHQLKTVSYWFGNIVAGAPSNTLKFIGYKPDPTTKLPKDTIFVVTKTVDEVAKGLDNNGFYNLDLSNTKVKFSGDFYVGISFGYKNEWGGTSTTTPQDTIAILSNDYQASGATINSAYIGFKTSNGFIFDTLIPTGKISYGIFPTICDLSSANDIVSFGFTNPAAQGVISGNTINVTVPIGTNLQSLIPIFTISKDAEITIGNVKQISGQTSNNYTNTLTYTVTADDGSTKNYTVVVTFQQAPKSNACDITAYSFSNPQSTGVINGNNITLTVPTGTNVSNLIAQFTASTGATVKVGSTTQISGQTANNFSNSVTYIVTAEDGTTTKSYTVTVNVQQGPKSNACDITSFGFTSPLTTGVINGNNITLTMPTGTNLTNLIAQFGLSTGATVKVGSTTQISGQTANNFSNSVTYTVTAEDGTTTKSYVVTVNVQQSPKSNACDITSFKLVSPSVIGVINGNSITLTVPAGTNVSSLISQFTLSTGASVKVGATTQVSGQTANNFTNAVTYVVTAEDGSTTKTYTVTVVTSTSLSSAKDILTFGFTNPQATGVINGTAISVTVPNGTDISTLVASFTVSPKATVTVKNVTQQSGKNVNDFTTIVSYVVTAEDGSTKTYTVTVTQLPKLSSDKDFLSFGIKTPAVNGTINGTTINVILPDGTSLSSLIATFTVSPKATVKVGSAAQTSGLSTNNFTTTVIYTVTAEDGTTKNYTVVVSTQSTSGSSAKELISFGIYQPIIPGVINGTTVTIKSSTKSIDVTSLLISFEVSPGAKLVLSGTTLTSRVSKLNFANPVTVTVVAADGTKKDYIINLELPKSNQKMVIFFKSMNPYSEGKIDSLKKEIRISVPYGTLVSQIQPVFMVSEGATVKIGNVQQISGANTVDFTKPVVYTIVAEDGSSVTYTVYVDVQPKSTLGIEEQDQNVVSIYPNPSNGVFILKATSGNVIVSIMDAQGRVVLNQEVTSYAGEEMQLDLTQFGKGIYFATVQNNESTKMLKLEVIE